MMNDTFSQELSRLQTLGRSFAVATVIAVRGSASAKPGSKAIISEEGKNIWGWVGGGCAESFVARNAVEAMEEGQTRIIQADLDDEIFGLGMPCGGVMDIFIEPQYPPLELPLATTSETEDVLRHLAEVAGFIPKLELIARRSHWSPLEHTLYDLAKGIAALRQLSFDHLCNSKGLPLGDARPTIPAVMPEFLIVGSSRITEELAKWGAIMSWPVRVYGWNLDPANYPESTTIEASDAGFLNFRAKKNSAVIVASHHKGDPQFITRSLLDEAAYVGLIASEKRSRLVFESLSEENNSAQRIFAPAGLEMGCRNPAEIALSCVAEILSFKTTLAQSNGQSPRPYRDPIRLTPAEGSLETEIP